METWLWLGAYLLGFVLLQVYLYRYFIRQGRSESGTATTGISRRGALDADGEQDSPGAVGLNDVDESRDSTPPEDIDTEDAVRCGECGAYNEGNQMFVYCRNCGERL